MPEGVPEQLPDVPAEIELTEEQMYGEDSGNLKGEQVTDDSFPSEAPEHKEPNAL